MWSSCSVHTLLVGKQNSTATLENSLAVSYKSHIHLFYDSTIPFLGICPRETKTYVHTKPVYKCL